MEKSKKKVAGRNVRGRGELKKHFRVLRAALNVFLFAPTAG